MPFTISRARAALALLCAWAPLQAAPVFARQGNSQVIAKTGDAAPGGGQYDLFRLVGPSINDAGQVAFLAHVAGMGDGDRVFLRTGPAGTVVARDGQAVAGGGTLSLNSSVSAVDDAGRVAFRGRVDPAVAFATFIFEGGTTTELVRSGQPAPGGAGTLDFLSNPVLNQSGQIALRANIEDGTPGGPRFGIFRAGPPPAGGATLTQIARHGDAAPDGNGTLSTVNFGNHAIDDAGRVAFSATLAGTSAGQADNWGVFVGSGGPLTQVLRSNAPAPDGNGTFSSFQRPDLNNAGQIVFGAGLAGTSGGSADNGGIYRVNSGGTPVQLARRGTLIPGGTGRYDIFRQPSLNQAGQVGFLTTLTDTPNAFADDSAVFRVDPDGTVRTIVREGQAAPGGGVIHDITDNNSRVTMNDAGQFALFLNLDDVPFPEESGIYFHDDVLGLLKVARSGDPFLGSTIVGLNLRTNTTFGRSLNDAGEIAYQFRLQDGREGVAVWAVPEPSGALVLIALGSLLVRRIRRR